jgi:hypothetical protein
MAQAPQFESRNATLPEFWDERFEAGFVPWDKGGVPVDVQQYFGSLTALKETQCLIPGCGNAYEAAWLASQGWDVVAIDFSPQAVAQARLAHSEFADRIVLADFFSFVPTRPLQCIYERAFFCALPPARRTAIVDRWATLLPVGGLLLGYFFIEDDAPDKVKRGGPPFVVGRLELTHLLSRYFECIEDRPVSDSIAVFENQERWQVWRKI